MTDSVTAADFRRLDSEIAEKVMGLKSKIDYGYAVPTRVFAEGNWWGAAPEYSTDIAAAWSVVEKMRERGFVMKLESWPEAWHWAYVGREGAALWESAEPESMPLAICRSALRAIIEQPA